MDKSIEKKKLSTGAIYFQSWAFPWRRMGYYLVALLAAVAIVCLFYYIGFKYAYEYLVLITILGIIAGMVIYKVIAGRKLQELYGAHIAVITEGLIHGIIPQPCIKEGLKLSVHVKDEKSILRLSFQLLKKIFSKADKKDSEKKPGALESIKAFTTARLIAMIPYLGSCSESWAISHPDMKASEAMGDGTKLFLDNIKKMLPIIIVNFIIVAGISITGMVTSGISIYRKLRKLAFIIEIDKMFEAGGILLGLGHTPVSAIITATGIMTVFYWLYTFLRPGCTIVVLEQFYKTVQKEEHTEYQ